jgi:hypothetical protein
MQWGRKWKNKQLPEALAKLIPVKNGSGTVPAPQRGRQVLPVLLGRYFRFAMGFASASLVCAAAMARRGR